MSLEVIDTSALDWEVWHPQYEGTKCKTLYADPQTGNSLKLAFVPSDFTLPQHTRHHHGSTREFVYLLFGDLPYVEYASPDADPRTFVFRQEMLLDRPPRSIHGMSIDPVSELGALVLEWSAGPLDFNAVPFDAPTPGEFNDPWVSYAPDVAWHPHAKVDAWQVRSLSTGGDAPDPTHHPITIVHVPGSWRPTGEALPMQGGGHAWSYVLDGWARVTISHPDGPQEVELRPGMWLRWGDDTTMSFERDWTEDLGVTLLCAGNELVVS